MISERSKNIPPFIVMDVLEKAKELEKKGENIIHLEIGEPDFETPKKIKQAAIKALEGGETHYTHSLGIIELREAIAKHYKKRYKVNVDSDQIIVTMGVSPALLLSLCSIVNPHEEVILSNPCYACYPNFVRYIDGKPVFVNVSAKEGFEFRPEDIKKKITKKTKAILINSPSNPTGNLISKEVMGQIADLGPRVISDEIYHGLVYEEKEHSILEFTDKAFVLNGFSKLYAMTGFRLGYIIAPKEFVRPIQKSQQNLFLCASSIAQWAAVSALSEEHAELPEMVKTYDERRKYVVKTLREIGFEIAKEPHGAFYVFADARKFSNDSYKLAFDILLKAKVAVGPGIDFGTNGEGFIRFSYANSLKNIKEGMERLRNYLEPIKRSSLSLF